MIENPNSFKSKLQFRCISHLPQEQAFAILQQLDKTHSLPTNRVQTQPTGPNFIHSKAPQYPLGQITVQRSPIHQRSQHQDSPIRKFIKQPTIDRLNYEYVVTWYQKAALEGILVGGMSQSVDRTSKQNPILVRRL